MSEGVQVPTTTISDFEIEQSRAAAVHDSRADEAALSVWVYALAVGGLLIHVAFSGRYGYFRDELYYAACGEHLAWGYVDHAPLVAVIARLTRAMLGDSLYALRFLPALAAAAQVYLGGWLAREVGGGKFAQGFAALAVLLAPIYLTFDSFLSMNAFEPVFWMVCAAILLRILNGGSEKLWLLFGLVAGLGIQNKHSMLFFGSGICGGLLLTGARREFTKRWIWLGGIISFLIFLPNLIWEIRNGLPTVQLLNAVIGTKYSSTTPWEFVWQQALLTHPLLAPVWVLGLWYFLWDAAGRKYAALGWAYLIVIAEMIVLHGKIYYMAPAYPMLFAAGAAWIEMRALPRTGPWLKPVMLTPMIAGGLIAAPLAMPILPVDSAVKYSEFWDVKSVHVENVPLGDLPQFFGDMFGWPEQAQDVARVYDALSAQDRAKCAILAYNYGEAGAIDYFGAAYHLPKSISGHNQYAVWGPRDYDGDVVIAIGFTEAKLREIFDDVSPAGRVVHPYALPEETNLVIYLCRRPKKSLKDVWGKLTWLG